MKLKFALLIAVFITLAIASSCMKVNNTTPYSEYTCINKLTKQPFSFLAVKDSIKVEGTSCKVTKDFPNGVNQ